MSVLEAVLEPVAVEQATEPCRVEVLLYSRTCDRPGETVLEAVHTDGAVCARAALCTDHAADFESAVDRLGAHFEANANGRHWNWRCVEHRAVTTWKWVSL